MASLSELVAGDVQPLHSVVIVWIKNPS